MTQDPRSAEAFWARVDVRGPDECWPFKLKPKPNGYGEYGWKANRRYAHRAAYAFAFGPIPEGLDVDHDCHNRDLSCPGGACAHRRCCNPAHLRATTRLKNLRSSHVVMRRLSHCKHGHELSDDNVYSNGACKPCARRRAREQKTKRRAAA